MLLATSPTTHSCQYCPMQDAVTQTDSEDLRRPQCFDERDWDCTFFSSQTEDPDGDYPSFWDRRAIPALATSENDEIDSLIDTSLVPALSSFRDWTCCLLDYGTINKPMLENVVVVFVQEKDLTAVKAVLPERLLSARVEVVPPPALETPSSQSSAADREFRASFNFPAYAGGGWTIRPGDSIGSSGSIRSASTGLYVQDASGRLFIITSASATAESETIVAPSKVHYDRLTTQENASLVRANVRLANHAITPNSFRVEATEPIELYTQDADCDADHSDVDPRAVGKRVASILRAELIAGCLCSQLYDQALISSSIYRRPAVNDINEAINSTRWNGWTIRNTVEPKPGLAVHKVGAVTGASNGLISTYRARRSIMLQGKPTILKEWCIIRKYGRGRFWMDDEVGAPVIHAPGQYDYKTPVSLVGLITGGLNYWHHFGRLTFFTPWSDIQAAFKAEGYALSLPV